MSLESEVGEVTGGSPVGSRGRTGNPTWDGRRGLGGRTGGSGNDNLGRVLGVSHTVSGVSVRSSGSESLSLPNGFHRKRRQGAKEGPEVETVERYVGEKLRRHGQRSRGVQ